MLKQISTAISTLNYVPWNGKKIESLYWSWIGISCASTKRSQGYRITEITVYPPRGVFFLKEGPRSKFCQVQRIFLCELSFLLFHEKCNPKQIRAEEFNKKTQQKKDPFPCHSSDLPFLSTTETSERFLLELESSRLVVCLADRREEAQLRPTAWGHRIIPIINHRFQISPEGNYDFKWVVWEF